MFLARRDLRQNKTRLALSVVSVALAVTLILLINGMMSGVYSQVGRYLEHSPGSVVVAQSGVRNLLSATSLLPSGTTETVRATAGVATAAPILSQFVILELRDLKQPAYLVGYEAGFGGGPWALSAGREPLTDDEAVFDRVLADRHGMRVGDRFALQGRTFTLSGVSTGTSSWLANYLFVRKSGAESLISAPGAASFLLVTPAPGTTESTLIDRLGNVPGAGAIAEQELIENDKRLLGSAFRAPMALMVAIAFMVGTLVAGLVIYTTTVERQREYGLLKAIGAENRMLYLVVVAQALIATLAGSALGVVLALGAGDAIVAVRPQLLITIEPAAVLRALLAGLAIALLAALAPARVIGRLAPADVFRR